MLGASGTRRPPARGRTALALLVPAAAALAGALALVPTALAAGSVSLTSLGTAYTQNFDTLASSGTTNTVVPTGWAFSESGTNANTEYRAGTGSDNTGDTYSFGATGNSERAFGGLRSGSLVPLIGAQFTNGTGGTITSLAIAYTGEQWRLGQNTTGRAADRLDFQLSANATSITTGTWTDYDSLDFSSPVVAGTVGGLNGNVSPNQTAISFTITGLSIPSGASFWIRWADTDLTPGADDGLSVDDLSLTPNGTPADTAPTVTSSTPANGATGVSPTANLSVTFSEPVNAAADAFSLGCTSGARSLAVTGGPTTFTLDPDTDLGNPDTCTLTVAASKITDQDGNDPPDTMVADHVAGFSVADVCTQAFTPIPAIQGSGLAAAVTGTITTKGVVVGDFEGTAAASGFYLQDVTGDGNPATSDGIFVFTGSSNLVSVGQVVRVTGFARERFSQTTINGSNSNVAAVPAANVVPCGTGSVSPVDVVLPAANADFLERYEGMLTRFPQPLVISEYFNYDRFGEIVLASPLPGETRPFTGTAIDEPGAAANARTLANSLSRITLDDLQSAQNPSVLRHPNGQPFSLENRFRGGDTVQNAVGVLGYDFNLYRILPTGPADYTATNPRPAAPEPVGGSVRVAAMNTLNFFVTADYPTGNPLDNTCGPTNSVECRGWDADQPDELTRQRAKLVAAIAGLDGDVVGLNELENTAGVDPLTDAQGVLAALNAQVGAGTYASIATGTIGTDAIRVGLIYKPSVVTPVGAFKLLTTAVDPRFIDTKSRPALAQTFSVNASGARFTVVVNHLKSKGSACDDVGDPDLGDGQGNCSQTRRAAAEALVDWIATDPTGSGDPDFLIVGDLNSYAKEDTLDEIQAGSDDTIGTGDDFTNLIAAYQGPFAYSYTFDGQAGYLDHALASASLLGQVTGAADWHINSDEPDVLDYDTSFKPAAQDALYEPNAFRSSDHDPVVVGLTPTAATSLAVTGTFYDADGNTTTSLVAQLSSPGGCSVGKSVDFYVDADGDAGNGYELLVGTGTTDASGVASVTWTFGAFGIYDVKAVFEGTAECLASAGTGTVAIVSPGDAANGGGWYQYATTGSPRVNFGFTVKKQKDGSYRGQLLWSNNGKWRIKGSLTSFGKVDPCTYAGTAGLRCGSSEGAGTLYRWNATTLAWDPVQAVRYVIAFVEGGASKKGGAKPDAFGITVTDYSSASLPESSPQQLKGGNILVP